MTQGVAIATVGRPVSARTLGVRATKAVLRFVRRKPLGAFGAFIILCTLALAAFPGLFAPYAYDDFDLKNRLSDPTTSHLLGTDRQGRDVLSRIIFGARTSIVVSFASVALATVVSVVLGLVSGYRGGWVDSVLQRIVDVWQAFPGLVFVMFAAGLFGPSQQTIIFTVALLLGAGASRIVRSQTITVRQMSFVESAHVIGASDFRIIVFHVLPSVVPVVIVNVSLQVSSVMLIESALSYLGYGVPPPFPSWGRMLKEAQADMQSQPYLALFPGLAIALTVYAFNMLGDALRDVLDPRMRGLD